MKQERNLLITTHALYNLKGFGISSINSEVKRRIDLVKIVAISVSSIGTEFVIHVPTEYDYRFASSDRREQIIYYILRGYANSSKDQVPIYYREELSLVGVAHTKEDKKTESPKYLTGYSTCNKHDHETYNVYLEGEAA